jgi:hypothetical protein
MKLRSLLVVITSFVLANGVIAPSYGHVGQQPQENNKQNTMTELEKIQHTDFSSAAPLQDVAPAQLSDENQKMEHDTPRSTVSVQKNPKDGVSVSNKKLGGTSVHVGLPYADGASEASSVSQGVVSYDNKNGSSTIPVAKNDGSLQMVTKIDNRDAPTEYKYVMGVPQGTKLVHQKDGSVLIVGQDGTMISAMSKPWAVDAQGAPVDTKYIIQGNELIQVIDHTSQDYKYPIVADPWMGIDLIDKVWVEDKPEGYVVNVDPTPWGRMVTGSGTEDAHVDELKSKLGDDAWRVDDHDGTIREQYLCHVKGNIPAELGTYNLESWWESKPWADQLNLNDQCNVGAKSEKYY